MVMRTTNFIHWKLLDDVYFNEPKFVYRTNTAWLQWGNESVVETDTVLEFMDGCAPEARAFYRGLILEE